MSHVMAIRDTCFSMSFEEIMKDCNNRDITIVGANGKLHAHRLVLSLTSSFFKGILQDICPAVDCCIIFPDYTIEFLTGWLTFLYYGVWDPFPDDNENFEEFLKMIKFNKSQFCYMENESPVSSEIIPIVDSPIIDLDPPLENDVVDLLPRIVETYSIKVERRQSEDLDLEVIEPDKEVHGQRKEGSMQDKEVSVEDKEVSVQEKEVSVQEKEVSVQEKEVSAPVMEVSEVTSANEDDELDTYEQEEQETYDRLLNMEEIFKELMDEDISESEFTNSGKTVVKKKVKSDKKKGTRKHSNEDSTLKCESCGKVCGSVPALKNHEKTHFPREFFFCRFCEKQFYRLGMYQQHTKVCPVAAKEKEEKTKVASSVNGETKQDENSPSTSGSSSDTLKSKRGRTLKIKIQMKDKSSRSSSGTSKKEIRNSSSKEAKSSPASASNDSGKKKGKTLDGTIKVEEQTNSFVCPECSEEFHSDIVLQQHIAGVHYEECDLKSAEVDEKPYIQRLKEKSVNGKSEEEEHSYHCTFCSKSFLYEFEFNKHFITHVPMPFDCLVCGKNFVVRKLLLAHIESHYLRDAN